VTDAPERAAEDILGRTVRLTLGRREWVLPVLTIAGNRRWKSTLDGQLSSVLTALRKSGGKVPRLYEVLQGQVDQMVDLLIAYDETHVLPEREELLETAYEDELMAAIQEVWRAANPLVAMAARNATMMAAASSMPTSSPPPSTAGPQASSSPN
jgi:hypothetical protein